MGGSFPFFKKERMNYEAKTFDCRRRDYCHCLIAILAFYSRRLERLAQCELIFRYYHAGLFR